MDIVEKSISRAQKTLNKSDSNENYVSIKINPINGGCCCFHCWPKTWDAINELISNYGHLEDEGDISLGDRGEYFVLQCHENGPEIIIPIGITGANLLVNVTSLILNIIKHRQKEKIGAQFKITRRRIKKSRVIEESVLEVVFPISQETINILNKKIKDILTRDNK